MKKLFLMLVAIFFVAISASAKKVLTETEGNVSDLKKCGKITVRFDFEGAMYDSKEPLGNPYKNLNELIAKVPEWFAKGYKKEAKDSEIVNAGENPRYAITIKVNNMDRYWKVFSLRDGNTTKMWGTITVKDVATGNVVCLLSVDECVGTPDYTVDESFLKCFKKLGEILGEVVKKGKL
ncbi:MAG: hypothetical protein HUK08_01920 [Bacteroidaceae bacterium]|nr:hypothetical protein [Bacteroidaceae bacterium]